MIIILILLLLQISLAFLLWRREILWIKFSWTHWGRTHRINPGERIWAIACVILDILITGVATGLLGLTGLYAASGGLFLSSLVSFFFFQPSRKNWEKIKKEEYVIESGVILSGTP